MLLIRVCVQHFDGQDVLSLAHVLEHINAVCFRNDGHLQETAAAGDGERERQKRGEKDKNESGSVAGSSR